MVSAQPREHFLLQSLRLDFEAAADCNGLCEGHTNRSLFRSLSVSLPEAHDQDSLATFSLLPTI